MHSLGDPQRQKETVPFALLRLQEPAAIKAKISVSGWREDSSVKGALHSACTEDCSLVPSTHSCLVAHTASNSRESYALFWALQTPAHTQTHARTSINK